MEKPNNLDGYELFYMEMPKTETDPLNEISTEIQDEHETSGYDDIQGLSTEQVSAIARDSLEDAPEPIQEQLLPEPYFLPDKPAEDTS